MNVLIAGSSGFVGTALMRLLLKNNVHISRLVRKKTASAPGTLPRSFRLSNSQDIDIVEWDPTANYINIEKLEKIGIDAVVNLAGESAHQRWTAKNQQRIVDSRLRSTSLLINAINKLTNPPEVVVSASGISYYNNSALRTSQIEPVSKETEGTGHSSLEASLLDESSGRGSGFLSRLVQEWEAAAHLDDQHSNLRIVNLRIGIVLGAEGGVLAKFLPLFKACLGAKWGTGRQYMSWISIDDIARATYFAIKNNSIAGPVNAVGPNPVTNKEFTETLGRVLSRPAFLTVPSFIARMFFGAEWADSTLLADYRIRPGVLLKHGFDFKYPKLQGFLEAVVKTEHSLH